MHKSKTLPEANILVVEDERPLLEAIKVKLENAGFGVVTARSVQQAMSYLEDVENITAIWLDHYLFGGKDGLDLLVNLKDNESPWRKIPVFVVSNTASDEKVQAYMRLGVEKYYTKSNHRLDEIILDLKSTLENQIE